MSEVLLFSESELKILPLKAPPDQAQQLKFIRGNYIANFISQEEERTLLQAIDSKPWLNDLKRRVQHYGYRYDYKARKINKEDFIDSLPSWVEPIVERLIQENIFKEKPDQMIVNEYQPGQGIAPHIDRDCFGPTLASISLDSACLMHLECAENKTQKEFDIILEPRSIVIYNGKSRYEWKHSIVARKSDEREGKIYPRKRRVSLTFRTVLL